MRNLALLLKTEIQIVKNEQRRTFQQYFLGLFVKKRLHKDDEKNIK